MVDIEFLCWIAIMGSLSWHIVNCTKHMMNFGWYSGVSIGGRW